MAANTIDAALLKRMFLAGAQRLEANKEWINELIGQAADGFGEGLEQREIKTNDGDICVSFWHSGNDYFMENEMDFRQRMSENHSFEEQQIGGM